MTSTAGPDPRSRIGIGLALAAASVALAIVVAAVFATASVSAGGFGERHACGTVIEPNAVTSACASALKSRSHVTSVLLGAALFGSMAAVVVAGAPSRRWPRLLTALVLAAALLATAGALLRDGVIDRTFGS